MAAKEAGGREKVGMRMVDRYSEELDTTVGRLWQIPFTREALEKQLETWEGPIAGRMDRTCDLGVLTFLGFIRREEAARLAETDIPYSALLQVINRKRENMFEMKTGASNITHFFDWIDSKLAVNHATIITFNRDGGALGHVSIYANVGGVFGTIDPQTQKTTVRNDRKFLSWAKRAGFTSISLPMISAGRPDKLLKFRFDEVCERGRDEKRVVGKTYACVYNVYSLLGILELEKGKELSKANKTGVFPEERARLLYDRWHESEAFKQNLEKRFLLPVRPFEFDIFMSKLKDEIGIGNCIPVLCGRAEAVGHMFVMAVDHANQLRIIEATGQLVEMDVHEYFSRQGFVNISLTYEAEKVARRRFGSEVRKVGPGIKQVEKKRKASDTMEEAEEGEDKRQNLNTGPSTPTVSSPVPRSNTKKRIDKMKKRVKTLREKLKLKKNISKDKRAEIDKEKEFLKGEIIRLEHNDVGMGKSRVRKSWQSGKSGRVGKCRKGTKRNHRQK